ncbi:hypothetical protein GBL_0977 [Geobacillus kaustophilus GBlys]|uniref:Uncharacterized protein n=1 Tax=Geobacillus kaustophilus GBlys TaxID=1337888 RepID=U2X2A4_GEOKU|nr:hypothetical protein GBL_0977 [Geobacillus kaustophilus GBlys]GAJ57598.1 hypothetical protein B23_0788 [Geobacillus thermoleovorans B23]
MVLTETWKCYAKKVFFPAKGLWLFLWRLSRGNSFFVFQIENN